MPQVPAVVSLSTDSFAQYLEQSKLTPVMWRLWALSAGLIALDGFDFFIIGVALPFLQQDFGLDPVQIGAMAIAALVGSLVGSLTLGPLTDQVGRERMLLVDVVLFVVATAGTVLAWDAWSLIGFRFLVGVAIGADYPLSVAYITENVPTRFRGRMVISAFTFQAIGALLGALTGWAVIAVFQALYPDTAQPAIEQAWRWMLGVGLALAIGVALLRFSFRLESPAYHLVRGEYDRASAAASLLFGEAIVLLPIEHSESHDTSESHENSGYNQNSVGEPDVSFSSLFSTQYRQRTILAAVPWFLQDIATYGIGIFTPTIIGVLAFAQTDNLMSRQLAASQGAALVDLWLIVGFLTAVVLIDQVGRIRLQIVGFLGMALGLSVLAMSDILPVGQNWKMILVFMGFVVFNLMMNAGPNATTFLLAGEIFPTSIRATGAGFAAGFAKAGAVLGGFALPLIESVSGIVPLLLGLAVCCILAAVLTYQFRLQPSEATDHGASP